uniref:Uncharacterized protein n=1 Tax=Rhizophora mucronata TaxID=61149 RepID=A0A2P2PFZ3_RHIMU
MQLDTAFYLLRRVNIDICGDWSHY